VDVGAAICVGRDEGLDSLVEAALREWLAREWPFEKVDWGDRARA
jgi:hypothetical protein